MTASTSSYDSPPPAPHWPLLALASNSATCAIVGRSIKKQRHLVKSIHEQRKNPIDFSLRTFRSLGPAAFDDIQQNARHSLWNRRTFVPTRMYESRCLFLSGNAQSEKDRPMYRVHTAIAASTLLVPCHGSTLPTSSVSSTAYENTSDLYE